MSTHDSPGMREIVLVMGMTGWGKSWWTKLYSRSVERKLIYDPSMSFPVETDEQGVQQYLSIEEITNRLLDGEQSPCVFNWGFVDAEDLPQAASSLFLVQNNLLIVEECATVFEKGQARLPEWGKRHVFYGRHRNCSIALIAQRPTYIPIDFRSQANRVITFCQHEGSDVDWLQDFYGKERMKRLPEIPKFTCFDWHNGQVSEYSIVGNVKDVFDVSLDNTLSNELPSFV